MEAPVGRTAPVTTGGGATSPGSSRFLSTQVLGTSPAERNVNTAMQQEAHWVATGLEKGQALDQPKPPRILRGCPGPKSTAVGDLRN